MFCTDFLHKGCDSELVFKRLLAGVTSAAMAFSMLSALPAAALGNYERDVTLVVGEDEYNVPHYSAAYDISLVEGQDSDYFINRYNDFTVTADISNLVTETDTTFENVHICLYMMGNRDWHWVEVGADFDENGHAEFTGNAYDLIQESFTENDSYIGRAGIQICLYNADDLQLGDEVSFDLDMNIDSNYRDYRLTVRDYEYGDGYTATAERQILSNDSIEYAGNEFGNFTVYADASDLISNCGISYEDLYISFYLMGNATWQWVSVGDYFDASGHAEFSGNIYDLIQESFSDTDTSVGAAGIQLSVSNVNDYELGDYAAFNLDWNYETAPAENPFILQSGDYKYVIEKQGDWVWDDEAGKDVYTIVSTTAKILKYTGTGGNIVIPSELDGVAVTAIGENAFEGTDTLTGVTIPDSVTNIGNDAFCDCLSLSSVTLPDNYVSIGSSAFYNCPELKNITIPENADIYEYSDAFGYYYDGVYSYVKVDGFKIKCAYGSSGYNYAVANGFDYEVYGLNQEGDYTYITRTATVNAYDPETDSYYDQEQRVATIVGYTGTGGDITIPDTLGGFEVWHIGEAAFSGNAGITSVTFPENISTIGSRAFAECSNLQKITLNFDNAEIMDKAFFDCPKLKEVTIPKNTYVSRYNEAFGFVYDEGQDEDVKVEDFKIYCYNETSGHRYATYNDFGFEVVDILKCGDYQYIIYEDTHEEYDDETGDWIPVTDEFAQIIGYLGEGGDITIPSELDGYTVKRIESTAFRFNSSITGITIPETVNHISSYAFEGCSSLSSVVFETTSFINIGYAAFYNCPGLKEVTIPGNADINSKAFGYVFDTDEDDDVKVDGFKIYCYYQTDGHNYAKNNEFDYEVLDLNKCGDYEYIIEEETYQQYNEETDTYETVVADRYAKIVGYTGAGGNIVIPSELDGIPVRRIGDNAFADNTDITGITIPDSLNNIYYRAFKGCANLSSIVFPAHQEDWLYINEEAFADCPKLKEVTIPKRVDVSNNSFGCVSTGTDEWENPIYEKLDGFKIYCYYQTDGYYYAVNNEFDYEVLDLKKSGDFEYIIEEQEIEEYNSKTDSWEIVGINKYAIIIGYTGAGGNITIPSEVDGLTVRYIGSEAFKDNTDITGVTIPESLDDINYQAFMGCSNLSSLTLPDDYIFISDKAFVNCPKLKEVTLPRDAEVYRWENAFGYLAAEPEYEGGDSEITGKVDGFKIICCYNSNAYYYAKNNGFDYELLDAYQCGDYLYQLDSTENEYYDEEADEWKYISKDYARIVEYTGLGGNIEIPAALDGYEVRSIGDYTFYGNASLTGVTIPDTVQRVGYSAFGNCENLASVTFPDAFLYINSRAFFGCPKLTEVTLYKYNRLDTDSSAFGFVRKPAVVDDDDEPVPESYDKVEGFTIYCYTNSSAHNYAVANGFDFVLLDAVTDGDYIYSVDEDNESAIIIGYTGTEKNLTIPEELGGYPVNTISGGAFAGNENIESVVLPETVHSIGISAFEGCTSLSEVTFGESSYIDLNEKAFFDCPNLKSLTFGSGYNYVSYNNSFGFEMTKDADGNDVIEKVPGFKVYCYYNSGAYRYAVDNKIDYVLLNKNICGDFLYNEYEDSVAITGYIGTDENVTVPGTINGKPVTVIGDSAFCNNQSIRKVTLPDSIKVIDSDAFDSSTLEEINLPEELEDIGYEAFEYCQSLKSITIPDSVTFISTWAFNNCTSLESAKIGSGVMSINNYTFANCTSLKELTLSEGLESIGDEALIGCTSLKNITVPKSVNEIGENAIAMTYNNDGEGYVPVSGAVIYGYNGSAAETYADENGIEFVALDAADVIKGDINGDGVCDAKDMARLKRYLADDVKYPLTKEQEKAADVNGDNVVDAKDMAKIKRYLADDVKYPL